MDDFKRPEENVSPQGETPVERTTSLKTSSKNSRIGRWLLWGIVVLLIAGLGILAYWQYSDAQNARAESESLKSALTVAQKTDKTATEEQESTSRATKPNVTTQFLANGLVSAYKTSLIDKNYSVKVSKVLDDYALITVFRSNSNTTTTHIYKNIDGILVALTSYDMDGWTESETSYWKSIYGINAESLGVPIGPESTM